MTEQELVATLKESCWKELQCIDAWTDNSLKGLPSRAFLKSENGYWIYDVAISELTIIAINLDLDKLQIIESALETTRNGETVKRKAIIRLDTDETGDDLVILL